MSGVASFVSALAEEMAREKHEKDPINTADAFLAMKSIGYDGPITLHCKSGVPQLMELGDRRWKLI